MDEGFATGGIITDFPKAFDSVPHDKLFRKFTATGVELMVFVWVKEFLLRYSQIVTLDRQLSEGIRLNSLLPPGSIFRPVLFVAYVNDIRKSLSLINVCSQMTV